MLNKLRKRCIYMCGDLGLQTITNFANIYLMIYLTDILGISPLAAGTMYAVARVWDAINDPLMGSIADRTRTRWGSYRPWFLFGALPLCAVFVLLFTVPNFSPSGKLVWAYVVYIAYGMLMTMVSIPYGALPNVLTTDSQERSILPHLRLQHQPADGFRPGGPAVHHSGQRPQRQRRRLPGCGLCLCPDHLCAVPDYVLLLPGGHSGPPDQDGLQGLLPFLPA